MRVDLPAPFSPITAVTSPARMVTSTSSRTVVRPYTLVRPLPTSNGGAAPSPGRPTFCGIFRSGTTALIRSVDRLGSGPPVRRDLLDEVTQVRLVDTDQL